ncbi:alpha/beta fold hydrolase [Ectopseudomonas alcaliphila]|uniref:alpha/beta fold hydrolase n=1 Tax=Ectopseudomonas alcaliphila TaxID=101564 RepID=UPI0027892D3C|nr:MULTISPECIES: alpha/beta hydrolase [Pseudomonas]MDP9939869.1 pimeloyl-ACP methyl ester carboxylesterase [Pseudomonas sp. 3400]MDR7012564.1 pimeloyl-ACP methyl ester carboxylesterase [Pseudomonas alcaliphila]
MDFSEYGNPKGKPVVYFHGVPGSPHESSIYDAPAREHGLRVLCFDRFAIDRAISGADYYRHIAQAINEKTQGAQLDVIGFSLGAHAALEVSALMPGQVRSLHLVSAAAPLDGGDLLNEMAGKAVFSMAKRNPGLFQWLVKWQALLAKRAPQMLFRMLFASAQGQDRELVKSPEFRALICRVLRQCFAQGTTGYTRDIQQYLQPWSGHVFASEANVCLWHGTEDNWSPFGMSEYLAERLPRNARIERMQGLSHYSCLYAAAPMICARLDKEKS